MFGGRSWLPLLASGAVDYSSWKMTQYADGIASGTVRSRFDDSAFGAILAALKGVCSFGTAPSPGVTPSVSVGGVGIGGDSYSDLMESAGRLPFAKFFQFIVWSLGKLSEEYKTMSPAETAEMQRRKVCVCGRCCCFEVDSYFTRFCVVLCCPRVQRLWAFYLLRSPLFHYIAKPCADSVSYRVAMECCLQAVFTSVLVVLHRSRFCFPGSRC